MKLRTLELENYGIHTSHALEFGESGLHVIYGANEAGKSTLLQAVRELLFGFRRAANNPYAPESPRKKMQARARLCLTSGTELEITRRQTTKNPLTGQFLDDAQPIDEARWQELLTGADQRLYQQVFGFSLKELATGEESLKEANVDEALFGGGMGRLQEYKQLLADIDSQMDDLFRPRGQKQKINALLNEIKNLKSELKKSTLRPAEYEEWVDQARRCDEELERLKTSHDNLFLRQSHLTRLKKALPCWIERRQLQARLNGLEAPDAFPQDALAQLAETRREAAKASLEIDRLRLSIADRKDEINSIHYNAALIEVGDDIRRLTQEIAQIRGFRGDVPIRQQERQRELDGAAATLRRVDPKLKIEQMAQFTLTLTDRERIKKLTNQHLQIQTEIASHARDVERVDREIQRLEAALTEVHLEDASQVERLQSCLGPFCDAVKQRSELEKQSRRLRRELDQKLALLKLDGGGPVSLSPQLPIPLEETIRRFEAGLDTLTADLREAQRAQQEAETDLATKREELRRLEQGAQLVSDEQLHQARHQRDTAWQSLRGALLDERSACPHDQLRQEADAYQQQVQQTDTMADQRQQHAETLAAQQQLLGDVRFLEERLARRQDHYQTLETQRAALWEQWLAEWAPAQLEPKSPREMLAWQTHYLQAADLQRSLEEKDTEAASLDEQIQQTLSLLPEPLAPAQAATWIETFVKRALDQQAKYGKLKIELQTQQKSRQTLAQENERRLAQLKELQSQADEILAIFDPIGEVDIEVAADLIQAIDEVHACLARARTLEQRIDDMQRGMHQFQQEVQAVIEATGEPLSELSPEDAAARLDKLLTEAENLRGERNKLEASQRTQQNTLAERERELAELEQRLAHWRTLVNVETNDQLEFVSQQVRERLDLEHQIATIDHRLALIRESEDAETFDQELAALDADRLELDLNSLTQELQEVGSQVEQAHQQLGQLRHLLREVDQSNRAVLAQGKIEALQAELSECLDRLGPLLIARKMLDRAMETFREENAGHLLTMVSQLLERMTGGRYLRVELDLDQANQLVLVTADDIRRTPAQLSTGTREQLYLAIRLAYIRHYCQKAEPLPVLMDDILVNFDDERQTETLKVLVDFDPNVQIVLLTCHKSLIDKLKKLKGEVHASHLDGTPIALGKSVSKDSAKSPSLFENV